MTMRELESVSDEEVFLQEPPPCSSHLHIPNLDWPRRSVSSPLCMSPGIRKIRITDVHITKLLGSGGFGVVYEGLFDFTKVAVKRFHKSTKNKDAKLESFRAEHRVLKLIHPNIVRTLACSLVEEIEVDALVVMEYVGERNLLSVCNSRKRRLHVRRRIRYALDIARALEFIHDNSIVHLDIKPANVFITPQEVCKVGDFGCCQELEFGKGTVSPTQRSSLTGTFAYRAPELLRGLPPNAKADVYSFGITLWQLWSGEQPYDGENQHVVVFGVVAYNLRPKLGEDSEDMDPVERYYRDLFMEAWDSELNERPSAKDIVNTLSIWKQHL